MWIAQVFNRKYTVPIWTLQVMPGIVMLCCWSLLSLLLGAIFDSCVNMYYKTVITKIDLFEVKINWQIFGLQNGVKFVLFKVESNIWYQNNQKFKHFSWNNPSVWYTWQHSHHGRICTTLLWTLNRSIFPQRSLLWLLVICCCFALNVVALCNMLLRSLCSGHSKVRKKSKWCNGKTKTSAERFTTIPVNGTT